MRKAQAEAARREARRRRIIMLVGGLVVLGLLAAITVAIVRASQDDDGGGGSGEVVVPANVSDGSIPVGDEGAPVTIAIYLDYMCPACGQFEEANGDELDRMVESGDIKVELRPISFLDQASLGTRYSTRSASAVATVADGSLDDVWAFHRALYAEQPEEGSTGLSNDEMADIAEGAGVPADVASRFEEGTYEGWVDKVTQDALESGVEGTPSVLIDGEEFQGDLYTPGAFAQAVKAAAGS